MGIESPLLEAKFNFPTDSIHDFKLSLSITGSCCLSINIIYALKEMGITSPLLEAILIFPTDAVHYYGSCA